MPKGPRNVTTGADPSLFDKLRVFVDQGKDFEGTEQSGPEARAVDVEQALYSRGISTIHHSGAR